MMNSFQIETGTGKSHPHMNPINVAAVPVPSAPVYGQDGEAVNAQYSAVAVETDDFLEKGSSNHIATPKYGYGTNANGEEQLLKLQADRARLRGDNVILENNLEIQYGSGDCNLPGGVGGNKGTSEADWQVAQNDNERTIKDSSIHPPSDVRRWDPRTDSAEGPSPLDSVNPVDTNYTLPTGHCVADPYEFGSKPETAEFKSAYDK